MSREINIISSDRKISAWAELPGSEGLTEVCIISDFGNGWRMASSMFLPSDIKAAEIVLKAYMEAFAKMREMTPELLK